MSRPITLDDLALVNGQPVGVCAPPPQQPTPPPAPPPAGQEVCNWAFNPALSFCDRLLAMEGCLIQIGEGLRDGDKMNLDKLIRMMQVLTDGKNSTTGADAVRSDFQVLLNGFSDDGWTRGMEDVWMQSLSQLVGIDEMDKVQSLMAVREWLVALKRFAVGWGQHHSVGNTVSGKLAAGLGA
jgi:hypothetical protein